LKEKIIESERLKKKTGESERLKEKIIESERLKKKTGESERLILRKGLIVGSCTGSHASLCLEGSTRITVSRPQQGSSATGNKSRFPRPEKKLFS